MLKFKQSVTFQKWVKKLRDERAKAIISARLTRLASGNPGDVKPVGESVSELRIDYGPGYRIYFIRRKELLIVLLCGGDKSSQDSDIRTAKRIAAQWSDEDE
ncbi:addiction module antitoxin RelB [Ochrobactrum sp. MYb29]|nr:addiction module antitoxin RelB [Ochrobactrum sp. MYb29]